jgi:hypothetical protein
VVCFQFHDEKEFYFDLFLCFRYLELKLFDDESILNFSVQHANHSFLEQYLLNFSQNLAIANVFVANTHYRIEVQIITFYVN